jgi:PAS domain S-box-containing protein
VLVSQYQIPLVVVSILVAIFASYFALSLTEIITKLQGNAARWWIAGGAVALGTGIWAMHFIGMLAFRLPIPIGYDWVITFTSLVLPIGVSALALWQASQQELPFKKLLGVTVLMGTGVTAMHYTGMAAMRMQPGIIYDPLLFFASALIALTASGAALWIAFRLKHRTRHVQLARLGAAMVMGLAIFGMHYTGMAAANFPIGSICRAAIKGFNQDGLAILVVMGTFGILTIAMLASSFNARLEARSQILALTQSTSNERQELLERERAARNLADSLRIQNEELLKSTEDRKRLYETILSATPDFVYVFEFGEVHHYFAYANDELLKMFGRSYEETVGKTFLELGYEPWHAEMHDKEIDTVRITKKPLRGEVFFDGTFGRRMYDYIFVPVFDAQGEVRCVAGTTRDVTDRYNVRETLRENEKILKLNEKVLRDADQRKDEFLAMLAHELRNPLAPISAAAHIMSSSQFDEARVRNSTEIIKRQVTHMVGLVDDLLDVSRVNRGLVNIEKTPQDLVVVISDSIEQVRPLIDSKQQNLTIQLEPGPITVLGDFKRLVQVVTNLLNNSAKYTQNQGNITLRLNTKNDHVNITISDDGMGITPEDQEIIFELFAQAKRSSDRSQGGLGLGLALVKNMVQLHGGDVICSSDGLGLGSQFTITLPLQHEKSAPSTEPKVSENAAPKKSNILVVDDNVDAAKTVAELLQFEGHVVYICHDPLTALDMVDRLTPEICILDIGLPEMDGNELAKRIRTKPTMTAAILIALTGYAEESDRIKSLKAGFNFHLAKPVDIDKLLEITNH